MTILYFSATGNNLYLAKEIGGAASDELQKIVSEAGASFSYINTIQMVDNWIPGFDMAKQKEIDYKKKVDAHLANIVADINASKKWICRNALFAKLGTKIMLKRKDGSEAAFAQSFTVEDNCTKCGTCEKSVRLATLWSKMRSRFLITIVFAALPVHKIVRQTQYDF